MKLMEHRSDDSVGDWCDNCMNFIVRGDKIYEDEDTGDWYCYACKPKRKHRHLDK